MKRWAAGYWGLLVAAAPVTGASALDWQADPTRILGDPSFLPLAGQVSGGFEYTYSAALSDSSAPGAALHAFDRQGNAFLPTLRYGITDDISVEAQLGWGNERSQNSYTFQELQFPPAGNPGTAVFQGVQPLLPPRLVRVQAHVFTRAIGADDPVFSITWRAVDQRSAPISVDLTAGYSPDIFDAREAGIYQTGSITRGGQRGTLEGAISRQTRWLTLRAYGTFGYDARSDVSEIGGRATERQGPHADYAGGLQSQARLLPWVALNLGVQADRPVQYDDRFLPGNGSQTVHPGGTVSPYVVAVVPMVPRRVVGEVGYQHDFMSNEQVDSQGNVDRVFDRESNLLFARLEFVFGPP
jgi:hypothetical protein